MKPEQFGSWYNRVFDWTIKANTAINEISCPVCDACEFKHEHGGPGCITKMCPIYAAWNMLCDSKVKKMMKKVTYNWPTLAIDKAVQK